MFRGPQAGSGSEASEGNRTQLQQQIETLTQELEQQRNIIQNMQGVMQTQQGTQQAAQQQTTQAAQPNQLPQAVKLEKPQPFRGQVDGAIVDTFLYQCELYFNLVGMTDVSMKVQFATLLLVEDAALWLRSQYTPAAVLGMSWVQFCNELRDQFKPVDHIRRARDRLANCRQTGGVQGYSAAFRRLVVQCPDVSKAEALDRYIRGLQPQLRQMVLVQNPADWETAAVIADRVASAGRSYQGPPRGGHQQHGGQHSGPTPMDLGAFEGQPQGGGRGAGRSRGDGRGRGRDGGRDSGRGRGRGPVVCWTCQQPGHVRRECPNRQQSQQKN